MARKYENLIDRVIANSVLSENSSYQGTPCWLWTGTARVNRTGQYYGYYNQREKGKVVHKQVHREVVRQIKKYRLTRRSVVLHLCNNTLCCNPEHLAGGSQSKNMKQCVTDGRHNGFKSCPDSISISKVTEPSI